jgi:hypothetical protein
MSCLLLKSSSINIGGVYMCLSGGTLRSLRGAKTVVNVDEDCSHSTIEPPLGRCKAYC